MDRCPMCGATGPHLIYRAHTATFSCTVCKAVHIPKTWLKPTNEDVRRQLGPTGREKVRR